MIWISPQRVDLVALGGVLFFARSLWFTPRCCRSWRDTHASAAPRCEVERAETWGWAAGNRRMRTFAPGWAGRADPCGCTGRRRRTPVSPRQTPAAKWRSAWRLRATWPMGAKRTGCCRSDWRSSPSCCTFAAWRTASGWWRSARIGSVPPVWRQPPVGSCSRRLIRWNPDHCTRKKRWSLSNRKNPCDCIPSRERPYRDRSWLLGHQDHHSGPTANETQ